MSFESLHELDLYLERWGGDAPAEAIRATARPTILFRRQVVADESLPRGAHKFGGHPDLPRSFGWPERPPWPDAHVKAAALRRIAEGRRAHVLGPSPDSSNEAFMRVASARIADIDEHCAATTAVLFEPFPLMFVAQFDLGALGALAGLDPAFPRHGLLSVFADFTWAGFAGKPWAFWHDCDASALVRRTPPPRLVAQHDLHSGYDARPWRRRATSALLHPTPAVTVPDHWWDASIEGSVDVAARYDSYGRLPEPPKRIASTPELRDCGDRLGGWPETLQNQHPEEAVDRDGEGIQAPGVTPWRNLYSFDPGHEAERTMYGSQGGGDRVHLMIREDDLKARRFEGVEGIAVYD